MREQIVNDAWSLTALKSTQVTLCSENPNALKKWQESELQAFADQGFPHRKQENWKYTNVSPIAKQAFVLPDIAKEKNEKIDVSHLKIPNTYSVVFINGYFDPEQSEIKQLPEGVIISDLKTALSQHDLSEELKIPETNQTPFSSLNSGLLMDGLFLSVPSAISIDCPIHLICINQGTGQATMNHTRHLILMGDNSQATIFEEYYGDSKNVYFNNVVTQIYAEQNAQVQHYKLQCENDNAFHIANTIIHQKKASNVMTHQIALGGRLSRDDLNYHLEEEGAHCKLLGLYCLESNNHIDYHSRIDHKASHCSSWQHYKGIVDGKSKAVFNGKIVVSPKTQQTVAHQSNQNLLLSKSAEINTKPELEIYADDVQCTHGATVGQLDEEALFYLQSRGIERQEAYQLLTSAFAQEIIDQFKDENIAKKLKQLIMDRLVKTENHGG